MEQNPTEIRTMSPTGGEKGVKPERYDLIPVDALAIVAQLYGKGAEKYDEHNWRKGYEWSKSYAALQRHANSFWQGEDLDPETGLPQMAAVVFHALTLITFMQEQPGFDDRYIPGRINTASEKDIEALRLKLSGPNVSPLEMDVRSKYPDYVEAFDFNSEEFSGPLVEHQELLEPLASSHAEHDARVFNVPSQE
jgi:hypothetical protein